jgi:hypothetical protein
MGYGSLKKRTDEAITSSVENATNNDQQIFIILHGETL